MNNTIKFSSGILGFLLSFWHETEIAIYVVIFTSCINLVFGCIAGCAINGEEFSHKKVIKFTVVTFLMTLLVFVGGFMDKLKVIENISFCGWISWGIAFALLLNCVRNLGIIYPPLNPLAKILSKKIEKETGLDLSDINNNENDENQ